MTTPITVRDRLGALWYRVRPLEPRFRSREAFVAHMASRGLAGDGTPLVKKP